MGMFWDTMRLLQGKYQKALQDHKLEYAEGIHDSMQSFDTMKPDKWIRVSDRLPTGDMQGVDVWTWDGQKVMIDDYCERRLQFATALQETGEVVPTTGWWNHYALAASRPVVTHWMPIKPPESPKEEG